MQPAGAGNNIFWFFDVDELYPAGVHWFPGKTQYVALLRVKL